MLNPPLVQKSSIAAAEIDQPKFADVLQMNKRVPARHFRRFQHDRVGSGSSERTTAFDRVACAIGRFQPGTFLWGCAHAEPFYQKLIVDAMFLRRAGLRVQTRRGVVGTGLLAFNFLPTLVMYTHLK